MLLDSDKLCIMAEIFHVCNIVQTARKARLQAGVNTKLKLVNLQEARLLTECCGVEASDT